MHTSPPKTPDRGSAAPPSDAGAPRLRLVGAQDAPRARPRAAGAAADDAALRLDVRRRTEQIKRQGLIGEADPRWVLAVRAAECLEGTAMPPAKREGLLRMARTFGLTPFDANLVIAIVQDQARRGYRPQLCPRMGAQQLSMVPLPQRRSLLSWSPGGRARTTALLVAGLIAAELLLLLWWLG